ncbi:MAG TPA: MBL fold metallo-hydrolase [Polyangiaceae bacterium]|nr:MBL fold metallo-hydrolase [Polyangiaceae bacterium]
MPVFANTAPDPTADAEQQAVVRIRVSWGLGDDLNMKVHHLNCATMCPYGGRLLSGSGGLTSPAQMICHVLLIETDAGLVLVDSGLGLQDLRMPAQRLGRQLLTLMRPVLDADETAARLVEALGFSTDDVRHIVLTHMDLDHAGGLSDFPKAHVHLHAAEHDAAITRRTPLERSRYRPLQWAHEPTFETYRPTGETWFGFEAVRDLRGLPPEILIIPLLGHSRGHSGVAVETEHGVLLHAGDAYFHRAEMDSDRRRCPPFLDVFQRIVEISSSQRRENQERLRQLARENRGAVRVFSAHDPVELERCQQRAERAA